MKKLIKSLSIMMALMFVLSTPMAYAEELSYDEVILKSISEGKKDITIKKISDDDRSTKVIPMIKGTYANSIFKSATLYKTRYPQSGLADLRYEVDYLMPGEEEHKLLVDTMKDITDIIIPDKSIPDKDKVVAMVDWLSKNIKYGDGGSSISPHSAFRIISDREGYCQVYASLFQLMADIEGIDSIYMVGFAVTEYHGWNMVKLDGQWVGVDATWHKEGYPYFYTDLKEFGRQRTLPENLYEEMEKDLQTVKKHRKYFPYL